MSMDAPAERLVNEARQLLEELCMDQERSNQRSALVLLALCHLAPGDAWGKATNDMLGTRAIMDWIESKYNVSYAPNTRETIRRFTLHQFVQAGLVVENDDDPDRPINSPRWNYRVSAEALEVIQSYGRDGYETKLAVYLDSVDAYIERYQDAREMHRISVTLPAGLRGYEKTVTLSPGGQNLLVRKMVEEFCPRFTPGGTVLYIDDTDKRMSAEKVVLESLGVSLPERGKAPDLIVWMPEKNWLFLMEACSTHGPVDITRKQELAELFAGFGGGIVYVSCFPSRQIMRRYLCDLAWETEVWCADSPDHMIHLDGEKFLGPYGV